MKKRYLKIIAVFLSVIMVLAVAGCTEKEPAKTITGNDSDISSTDSKPEDNSSSEDSTPSDENTNREFEVKPNSTTKPETQKDDGSPDAEKYKNSKKIALVDASGNFTYNVINPAGMSMEQQKAPNKVFRMANRLSVKKPVYQDDSYPEIPKEILVGNTNRKESSKALELLEKNRANYYYDYIIAVIGTKIVIAAGSDEALDAACDFFTETFLQEGGKNEIPSNYSFINFEEKETCMTIDGVDIVNYVLLCESSPSRVVYKGLEEIQAAIKEKTDIVVPIIKDNDYSKYKYSINASVTGNNANDYAIAVKNKSINITGGHNSSVNAGLHTLAANIANVKDGYRFNIPSSYKFNGKYTGKTKGTDGYSLVFADEFDGDKLNTDYWTVENSSEGGYASQYNGKSGMLASNVYLQDGKVFLRSTATDNSGKEMTGSFPDTNTELNSWGADFDAKWCFLYGMFEIKVKIPKSTGIWPSFWAVSQRTLEKNYSAEIDVFEFFGTPKKATSNLHSWWTAGRKLAGLHATESQISAGHIMHLTSEDNNSVTLSGDRDFSDDYHTFTCEWTPEKIEFACDGEVYCSQSLKSMLKDPDYGYSVNEFMLFLNKSVYMSFGNSTGRVVDLSLGTGNKPNEDTVFPNYMAIEYYHLYQQEGVGYIDLTGKRN